MAASKDARQGRQRLDGPGERGGWVPTRKAEIVALAASEGARRGREQTLTQTRKKDLMSACLTFISYKYYILVVMQQPYKKNDQNRVICRRGPQP